MSPDMEPQVPRGDVWDRFWVKVRKNGPVTHLESNDAKHECEAK